MPMTSDLGCSQHQSWVFHSTCTLLDLAPRQAFSCKLAVECILSLGSNCDYDYWNLSVSVHISPYKELWKGIGEAFFRHDSGFNMSR